MQTSPTLRVFLSSTAKDLTEHRAAVSAAIRGLEHLPIQMETFGALSADAVQACRGKVASCDVLVVMVAHRHGWVADPNSGHSITRLEVQEALDQGVPVLGFVVDPTHPWPHAREEARLLEPGVDPAQVKRCVDALQDFKTWLGTRVIDRFTTAEDLALKVTTALSNEAMRQRATPPPSLSPPPAGGTLARYRQVLHEELDQLPSVFRHGPRAVSEVYVDVQLAGAMEADKDAVFPRHEAFRGRDIGGRRRLREVVERTDHRRWVLLGDPGSGKSTLLRYLGLELIADRDGLLPIWLRVSELQPGHGLADILRERYGDLAVPVLEAVSRGEAVLLLDGLDEHPHPEQARRAVSRLATDADQAPVVVTSRPIGFRAPSSTFAELRLCPLDEAAQATLLGHWVSEPATVHRTLQTMRARPRLRRMVENPLLLTFVGLVVEQGDELPTRRSALYRLVVGHLLRGSGRSHDTQRLRVPSIAEEALGYLALTLHGQEGWVTPEAKMLTVLRDSGEPAARLRETWPQLDEFLREVAQTTGLLVPFPELERLEGYTFPHRSLGEYLAARALEADIGRNGIGALPPDVLHQAVRGQTRVSAVMVSSDGQEKGWWARLWSWLSGGGGPHPVPVDLAPHSRLEPAPGALGSVLAKAVEHPATWAEVLSLTCGLLGEGASDQLVRRIAAEGNAELVARVVGEAEAIATDTVTAALGVQAGPKHWESRRDLLQELAALVGDAHVVMSLLHRFAKTTTHGADLWWACHLLEQLGHGVCGELEVPVEVQREAAHLAATLWSHHRPTARAEALAALEPWWRPIPEGEFLMGSPDGEAGRHDDEGPRHRVTVAGGLRMLGVPVTNRMYEWFDPDHEAERAEDAADHPVADVTWYEAVAFACWVGARLPVEAEWEYGCRAGTTTRYGSGDTEQDLERVGWVDSNSGGRTHPVADKPPNAWGLHDMHGNVWEWCHDEFAGYPTGARPHDPAAVATWPTGDAGAGRVIRGGSFCNDPRRARSAFRLRCQPWGRSSYLGFRLVRASAPQS